jgi:gamma-glutamylaminecyclotransferase
MTHRVFVYGTLKRGFRNHRLLEGCALLGGGATVPTYKMIETSFPVIMPDRTGKPVAGEIYTVDDETLARLDQLEKEGRSYDRQLIDVTSPAASACRARRSSMLDAKIASAKHFLAARSMKP